MTRWFSIALVVLLSMSSAASVYAAAGSVSLLGVSGRGGERFADSLEQDIGELYDLVPGDVYRRRAEQMGKRGPTPAEVSAVCNSLRIDALVAGAVSGDARARVLVIVVREGASGEVIARKRYDLSARTLPLLREQVMRDLVRVLERVRRIPKHGAVAVSPPPPVEPEDEGEVPAPRADEPSTQVVHEAPAPERGMRGFFAAAGPAFMTRSLSFDVASAPGYARSTVAAISVEGGVFPLALSSELAEAHPILASFGLLADYERAFNFTSVAAIGGSAAGHASRWSAVLAGRIPLGHAAAGGTLSIETGFQRISWGSSSPAQLGVPDVTYALIVAGLAWDRALGTRYLELSVRFGAQGLIDGGMITSSAQYGAGTGWGLDFDAGLTARPTRWLWLRLAGRVSPLFLSFREQGARFARSATDQFGDGVLEVGFAL